ncbi:MAG: FkbM family methyltransferase [Bacteroidetes bacterium]|nr:FkbM family methyltransferase [Bacteroidota bacterium]
MKNRVKLILQKILGYRNYLFVFAKYKIRTLKNDRKEKDFFVFMDEIPAEGDILDVGANIGIMTYHLAKRFPEKTVLAIEPMPSNFVVLKKITEKYELKNVELVPLAVGETKKELDMVLPVDHKVRMQGLAHVVHDSIKEWNTGEIVTVSCDTLDHITGTRKIAGIKMDIENFEYFALKGATRVLLRDKPVVYMELWANENRDNCFKLLQEINYKIYVSVNEKLELYDPIKHKQKQNFVFKVKA